MCNTSAAVSIVESPLLIFDALTFFLGPFSDLTVPYQDSNMFICLHLGLLITEVWLNPSLSFQWVNITQSWWPAMCLIWDYKMQQDGYHQWFVIGEISPVTISLHVVGKVGGGINFLPVHLRNKNEPTITVLWQYQLASLIFWWKKTPFNKSYMV